MNLKLYTLLFFAITFSTAYGQTQIYKNEVGFQSDNDGFLGQGSDRFYTAGNFGYFRRALSVIDNSLLQNKVLTFELGQKIYTPQSGSVPSAAYIDRPFAGYLYIGSSLNLLYKNESNLKLEVQTGFIGHNSYGEQIQDLIHNTFGFYHPEGWQYQIQNAYQLNLSAQYNSLLVRAKAVDLSFNSYANLGTGIDGAGVGFMARLGNFNQLFNSASTGSTVIANKNIKPLHNNGELFFYYKPILNFVAYDATIQGGLFEGSPKPDEVTATKNPILFNQQLGVDLVKSHWVVDASAVFETRETKQMALTGFSGHQWGSVSVLYRFN